MSARLISSEALNNRLAEPSIRVFDCRFFLADKSKGLVDYNSGHIPGSLYANLDHDLSNPHIPGITGRHPMPDVATFQEFLRSAGLKKSDKVVVYDQSHGGIAARLWWLLMQSGHDEVYLLEGGWKAWENSGFSIQTEAPSFERSHYSFKLNQELSFTHAQMRHTISAQSSVVVDARAHNRFLGIEEPIDPIAGHIPGAVNLPFQENLDSNSGAFKPTDILRKRFQDVFSKENEPVFYCGSGVTACHNIFASNLAGFPIAKLYVGSWSRWIADPNAEIIQEIA